MCWKGRRGGEGVFVFLWGGACGWRKEGFLERLWRGVDHLWKDVFFSGGGGCQLCWVFSWILVQHREGSWSLDLGARMIGGVARVHHLCFLPHLHRSVFVVTTQSTLRRRFRLFAETVV